MPFSYSLFFLSQWSQLNSPTRTAVGWTNTDATTTDNVGDTIVTKAKAKGHHPVAASSNRLSTSDKGALCRLSQSPSTSKAVDEVRVSSEGFDTDSLGVALILTPNVLG